MKFLFGYLILLTVTTSLVHSQCSGVSEEDSLQLVELHFALNGSNWGDTVWLNDPVSLWSGITLTEDSCNVLEIQIIGSNIVKGQIPNDLTFPFLEVFNLNNDSIFGDIPDFANCPNLEVLNLASNSLTGSIPDFMLDSLRVINLIDNGLTGEVPDFQGLPSLTSLQISTNELSGAFPSFSNMLSLNSLGICPNEFEIGYPDLTGAPLLNIDLIDLSCLNCTSIAEADSLELRKLFDSLGGDSWLNKTGWIDTIKIPVTDWFGIELSRDDCEVIGLNFESNNLSNIFPEDFAIETITSVRLNQNSIGGIIPDFAGLPNLELLDLFSNSFYGGLPDFQLPNLVSFDASFNNLSGALPDFSGLPKLEKLSLRLNKMVGPLPELSSMDSLKFLTLDFNEIDGRIPDFQLPNLEIIDLADNQLGGEIPDFSNMPKLDVLSLENNGLCGNVPNFSTLPNLSFLSVCPNPYLYGSVDLSNTPNLDIDNTDLDCIQENIDPLPDCADQEFNALEELSNSQITVFPNPTSGTIQLNLPNFSNATVKIYNTLGALIFEKNIYNTQTNLDLSPFENGMYVLEVILEERFVLKETVVKVGR